MANSGGIRLCPTPFNELEITLPLGGSAKPGRVIEPSLNGISPKQLWQSLFLALPKRGQGIQLAAVHLQLKPRRN